MRHTHAGLATAGPACGFTPTTAAATGNHPLGPTPSRCVAPPLGGTFGMPGAVFATMYFSIQLGAPMTIDLPRRDAESLKDLIEDSFPHETEDAYLNWNGVRIALNYKYDVSTIVDDIVSMLAELLERPEGTSVVEWPSNTFRATWHLSWSGGQLTISADWIAVVGRVESALRSAGALEIPVDAFIAEWSELVRFLASRLDLPAPSSGLDGLAEFQEIARATAKTPRGRLYRDLTERAGT